MVSHAVGLMRFENIIPIYTAARIPGNHPWTSYTQKNQSLWSLFEVNFVLITHRNLPIVNELELKS